MPLRHNPVGVADPDGPAITTEAPARAGRRVGDDRILDAARHLVLTQGLGRTTLTDVARQAGLSRMTVYRRWPGLPELLGRVMQREWNEVLRLDDADLAARLRAAERPRAFLVDEIVGAARALRSSELLRRIITAEPHLLTPYLVERPGSMHRLAREVIGGGIAHAQARGAVRGGAPALLATAVVLTVQSWVVSLEAGGADQPPAALDDELRLLLDRYLAPTGAEGSDR